MANPNPSPGTRFQPGRSGNPLGRPRSLLTQMKVAALLGRFWDMTRSELQSVVNDHKSTMGEIMIASVMIRSAKDGDASRLTMLLDRAVGRVKDTLFDAGCTDDEFGAMTPEQRREHIDMLLKKRDASL